jgi:hypothetical protein
MMERFHLFMAVDFIRSIALHFRTIELATHPLILLLYWGCHPCLESFSAGKTTSPSRMPITTTPTIEIPAIAPFERVDLPEFCGTAAIGDAVCAARDPTRVFDGLADMLVAVGFSEMMLLLRRYWS